MPIGSCWTPPTTMRPLTALRERFGIDASIARGAVTFHVDAGEAFVPRLFAELGGMRIVT